MKILFHVNLRTMLRHFESVVLELAARGHTVRVASAAGRKDVPPPEVLASNERVSFVEVPDERSDAWATRIDELRMWRDYLRYLDKRFEHAPKLRARAIRKLAAVITHQERTHLVAFCPHCEGRLVDNDVGVILRTGLSKKGFNNLRSLFALIEETIPGDPVIDALLREERPDVLVITPLIKLASRQPEFVKSARSLGIPVGLSGVQLGQPVHQGARARAARRGPRLERPPADRGGRDAPGAVRTDCRHRCVTVRRVLRDDTADDARRVLPASSFRSAAADRQLSLLVRVRRGSRARIRPAVDRRGSPRADATQL